MSKNLSSAAMQEFDSLVHQVFQSSGKLEGCYKLRSGITGDSYKFRTMGKGLANQKASQADVTPMDITHSLVTCTLENWNAPEYSDIFDQAEVNFDEKAELAQSIAMALGRRRDQLVIDALDAVTKSEFAGNIVHGSAGLSVAKMLEAKGDLDSNEVPEEGRVMIASTASIESLLNQEKVSSADYNTIRALTNGEIDTFLGFKFKFIGSRGEGGLTSQAANRFDGYAYHQDAIGMAVGIDQKTEINYVPEKTSFLVNGMMKAGAAVIDKTGIVAIEANEA